MWFKLFPPPSWCVVCSSVVCMFYLKWHHFHILTITSRHRFRFIGWNALFFNKKFTKSYEERYKIACNIFVVIHDIPMPKSSTCDKAFCLNRQFEFRVRWDQIHVWQNWNPNFMGIETNKVWLSALSDLPVRKRRIMHLNKRPNISQHSTKK